MRDEKLLALVEKATRSPTHFAKLCELKARQVVFLCIREMGHPEDGMDAAQEVFIRMQRGIGKLRAPEAFNVWLHRIIVSTCNDMRRKNMSNPTVYNGEEALELLPDALQALPQAFLEDKEARDLIVQMVDELPAKYRSCVMLHYYSGLSYADIAETLGITTAAVDNNLRMARKHLRLEMEERLPDRLHGAGPALPFAAGLGRLLSHSARETVPDPLQKRALARVAQGGGTRRAGLAPLVLALAAGCAVLLSVLGIQYSRRAAPAYAVAQNSLAGRVALFTGEDSEPRGLAGVMVELSPLAGGEALTAVTDGPEGNEGEFVFAGVPDGEYILRLQLPPGAELLAGGGVYRFEEGDTQAVADGFLLCAPATITGRVRLDEQALPAQHSMTLLDSEGTPLATTQVDGEGHFAFTEVEIPTRGMYTLRFAGGGEEDEPVVIDQQLELYPGFGFVPGG